MTGVQTCALPISVNNLPQYSAMVEDLRETAFWDRYFNVLQIIPTVEDGYAKHYEQAAIGKPASKRP